MGYPSGLQFHPNVCGCQKQVPLVVGNLQRCHGKAAALAIMTRPDSMHPTPALLSSTSYSSSWRILLLFYASVIYFLQIQLVKSQSYYLGIREKQVAWKKSKGLKRLISSLLWCILGVPSVLTCTSYMLKARPGTVWTKSQDLLLTDAFVFVFMKWFHVVI